MKRVKRNPSIHDAARLAGVSISTISNVLDGKRDKFSAATEKKVLSAVRRLNYCPNSVARNLVRQKTSTLGFVVPHENGPFTRSAYYVSVLDGMLEAAMARAYQVKFIAFSDISQLLDGSIDAAALIAPNTSSPLLNWASTSRIPCVSVSIAPTDPKVCYVGIDDHQAACEAISWLISSGHRRIAIITDRLAQRSGAIREQAYLDTLRAAGIEPLPNWRFYGNYNAPTGHSGALQLWKAKPRPTAIFCCSDYIALGALKALQEIGVAVPGEVSLIGFDDIEAVSHTTPGITTVKQPLDDLGRKTVEILIDHIETGVRDVRHVILPTTLVHRASVARHGDCPPSE
jgi:DNA-binding LacI/PurR family transcriptional regulator